MPRRLLSALLTLPLLLLPLTTLADTRPQPLDVAIYFTDNITATDPITNTTAMEAAVISLLDSATSSIDASLYALDRSTIITALLDAHARNVTVRVTSESDNQPDFAPLISAGIPVISDTRSYLMHNKFLVIDSRTVWTGSTNITDRGFALNHNNSVAITCTQLANVYETEFEVMFIDRRFHMISQTTRLMQRIQAGRQPPRRQGPGPLRQAPRRLSTGQ